MKKMNPKLKTFYDRPPTFVFSGIESKTHFDLAYSAGVRNYLMAILHCKKIKPAEMERRFGNGDCRLMIDSSTFTFHTKMDDWIDKPLSFWEKFIEEYLDFVRKYADYITSFVELDITAIVGVDKVKEWRKKYFVPFEEETGIPCLFMYQPDYPYEEWVDMCKRYNYVGFSGEAGIPDRQVIKMLQVAKKHNVLVHGMAFTKVEKLKTGKYPFYSFDSISWKSSEMYGVTYIFDGKNFIQFDKTQKHRRKKYKTTLQKQGVNWDLIKQDQASEVTRMALIAWTNMSKYISDMLVRTGKAYWLKGRKPVADRVPEKGKTKMSNDGILGDNIIELKFPPPVEKWEEDDKNNWEEIAESLYINPRRDEMSIVLTLIDILNCMQPSKLEDDAYQMYLFTILSKNEAIVDYLYDTYVEGNFEPDEKELPEGLLELIEEDTDLYDEESYTYNGNDLNKLSYFTQLFIEVCLTRQLGVFQGEMEEEETERPEAPQERDSYAGDVERNALAVAERDENGRFKGGNLAHLKRNRSLLANVPKLACDTCYAAESCYHFKPKSVCYYDKELNKFDTRNVDDILDVHSDIVNMSIQRLQLARIFEQFDGGMPDKMVTDLMNQTLFALESQRKLVNATSRGGQQSGEFTMTASGDVGNSVISRLFGDMSEDKPVKKDVTPTEQPKSSAMDEFVDAEFYEINDMEDDEDVPKAWRDELAEETKKPKKKKKKLIKKKVKS